jgi:Ca2+-binding EF-hand superfamily protein
MGCCSGDGEEVMEDPLSNEIIEYIRDRLEANLVKQTTLNAELNNIYKKIQDNKNITPDEVIKEYGDLLITLTNTTTEKESNDIKTLLQDAMKLVNNNYSSFHIIIFEKLQGLKDYSKIKEILDKNPSLKKAIKDNSALLDEVFKDLKEQGITDISALTFEKFKEVCTKHGVKMTDEELKEYYKLLTTKPRDGIDISADIKNALNANPNLRQAIEKNKNGFFTLINQINKEGIDVTKLSLEEFKKLCKECGIKLSDKEMEELYNLIQSNYLGFINYMYRMYGNKTIKEDNLMRKANKINTLASVDLQTLPVAQKLDRNF